MVPVLKKESTCICDDGTLRNLSCGSLPSGPVGGMFVSGEGGKP
jgi:hypothetical protein